MARSIFDRTVPIYTVFRKRDRVLLRMEWFALPVSVGALIVLGVGAVNAWFLAPASLAERLLFVPELAIWAVVLASSLYRPTYRRLKIPRNARIEKP